jgi:hypothetical protein
MGRRRKIPPIQESQKKEWEEKLDKIDFGENQSKKEVAKLILELLFVNVSQTRTQLIKDARAEFIKQLIKKAGVDINEIIQQLIVSGILKNEIEETELNLVKLNQ